jgi:hypothetical protein
MRTPEPLPALPAPAAVMLAEMTARYDCRGERAQQAAMGKLHFPG